MTRKPLLTIESLHPERDTVTIVGEVYELKAPSEFGLRDQRRISQLGKSIGVLSEMDKATDDQLQDAEFDLNQLLLLVFVDPGDFIEKLPLVNQIGIATAFFTQLNATMTASPASQETEQHEVEVQIDRLIGDR